MGGVHIRCFDQADVRVEHQHDLAAGRALAVSEYQRSDAELDSLYGSQGGTLQRIRDLRAAGWARAPNLFSQTASPTMVLVIVLARRCLRARRRVSRSEEHTSELQS